MEDSRGVRRGKCDCGNCDEFEWIIGSNSSQCSYCGCFPTKHRIIKGRNESQDFDTINAEQQSNVSSQEIKDALDSDIWIDDGQNFRPYSSPAIVSFNEKNGIQASQNASSNTKSTDEIRNKPFPNDKQLSRQPSTSISGSGEKSKRKNPSSLQLTITFKNNENYVESIIPKSFPHNIDNVIKSGVVLLSTQKASIIRETTKAIIHKKLSTDKDIVEDVAKLLCQKIPTLKGKFGLKHEEVLTKMNECIKNHARYARKKDTEDISIQILCTEMEKEVNSVGAKSINVNKLKQLLEKTRNKRGLERNQRLTYLLRIQLCEYKN
ncbi:uncharacterized protein LOC122502769 [Leptopilina heterotoma]|uniref:uncharacterized protein LOC122502769 n=1 Tax=Leptopilina heterotoma TaxID=63436 RepID=UPI001CA9A363|nr:uncharacterized protein LOC122502769 [Leptopilina heterotoma]